MLSREPENVAAESKLKRALLEWLDRLAILLRRRPRALPIHAVGRRGEELAYWYLRDRGYTILARNVRLANRSGEIDLVARDAETLVFVEVKTRTSRGEYPAEQAVDEDKRKHLIGLARAYARRRGWRQPCRFDVVAIYGPDRPSPEIVLHKNAFRAAANRGNECLS